MLAIKEKEADGAGEYVTYIYYTPASSGDVGYIREIFLGVDNNGETIGFNLNDGEKIIESRGFDFDLSDGRIKINLTDADGNMRSAQIILRAGKINVSQTKH